MPSIAIIIERDTLSVHEARLIETIEEVWSVTVVKAEREDLVDVRYDGWFHRLLLMLETWLVGLVVRRLHAHRRRIPVSWVPLRALGDRAFDLVLNLCSGDVPSALRPPSTNGLLSVHYGNVKEGIEGPPGFWESCFESSASGWWLVRELKAFDADRAVTSSFPASGLSCVFSGRYKTKRVMSMNEELVMREGHVDLAQELLRLARNGFAFRELPIPSVEWRKPGFLDVIRYRITTVLREVGFFLRTKARGRQLVFSVGIAQGHWQEADLAAAIFVPNPPGSYLADPFLVERDGRTVCYVEEFDLKSEHGRISWLDLGDGTDTPEYCGTLIEEPYHMSFPFTFEYQGQLYMVPETFEAGEISLYGCLEFPDRWERTGTLMDNVEASDTMIFEQAGRWWMLTNLRPEGALDFFSRLYVFWSDNPTSSGWTPHPLNPVIIDADGGRNGGLLRDGDDQIFRVGQEQSLMTYGAGWSVSLIRALDPQQYDESTLTTAKPTTSGHIVGGHHVHGIRSRTALDVLHLD